MAQGGQPPKSVAQLKRELDSLAYDINNIDQQIQELKKGQGNQQQIDRAKLQRQKEVLAKQVQFEYKKPRTGDDRLVSFPGGSLEYSLLQALYGESIQ